MGPASCTIAIFAPPAPLFQAPVRIEPDLRASGSDHPRLGQGPLQGQLVDVPVHRCDRRAELDKGVQNLFRGEVAGMKNEVGCAHGCDACIGDAAGAAGQVCVGDDGDDHGR